MVNFQYLKRFSCQLRSDEVKRYTSVSQIETPHPMTLGWDKITPKQGFDRLPESDRGEVVRFCLRQGMRRRSLGFPVGRAE